MRQAAPEMLDALQWIVAHLDNRDPKNLVITADERRRLRDAIAKATTVTP